MVTKSKMFSRAAAGWMIIFFLTEVYSFFMSIWQECKYYDEKFWKTLKSLFTEKSTRESMWLWVAAVVVMLVLAIALFANNRGVFLVGAILNCGVIGYKVYKFIDYMNKQKNVKWTADFTLKFIVGYVVVTLAALFILLMAISVLSGSSAAKGFGVITAVLAFVGLAIVVLLDILPYAAKEWKKGTVTINVTYLSAEVYFFGLVSILLIVKWGCAWADEVAAKAKNSVANGMQPVNPYSVTRANPYMAAPAAGFANPAATLYTNPAAGYQTPPAPQQPAYQAPQQPAYQAPQQPAYQAPQQPQQPAYKAPEQPAYQAPQTPQQPAYQAPQQPAYQAPEQPAYQAPQQPAYQAPEQPAYQAPQQPAYQAPEQPAYQAPEQPAYQAPEQPAYQAPEQPAYQAPEQSVYQAPEQPAYQAPEQPAYQAPVAAAEEYAANAADAVNSVEEAAEDAAGDFSAWTGGVIPGAVNEASAAVNDYAAQAEIPNGDVAEDIPRQ